MPEFDSRRNFWRPMLNIKRHTLEVYAKVHKIEYIEDRCTKMEYQKYFLKVRQAFPVLQN